MSREECGEVSESYTEQKDLSLHNCASVCGGAGQPSEERGPKQLGLRTDPKQ